ncbi:GntR family transcriptional regulator [Streptomyces sp. NPDC049687]|uniref:GntR family transcriptional regulator n=1 Tax=Streptomyces sp. NPDC049687 TaxID=3365596 RepID=UPI0037BC1D6C
MDERRSSDGGGREFQRVSDALRARIADGTYPVRTFLPSQRDLAEEFEVSRDTVQRVLRDLAEGGWIKSRQGSGSQVIRVPRTQPSAVSEGRRLGGVTLGPVLDEAFERPEVTLDVYSLTSESLDAHLRVQAERIYSRAIRPQRIALRLILPSEDLAVPYPRVEDDPADARLTDRLHVITRKSTESVRGLFRDLQELVPDVDLRIRHAPLTPTCKLYLLNGTDALLAPYQVIRREISLDTGEKISALDVLGFGAPLTRHVKDADPDSAQSVFVDTWQAWFDSVWDRVAA